VSPARAAINAALEAARAATLARTGARPPMRTAAPEEPAPQAPQAPAMQAAAPAKPLPWEESRPQGEAAVLEAPPAVQPQARPAPPEDDDLPPWVTEFSDDSAIAAPAQQRTDVRAEAPVQHRADARAEAPAAAAAAPVRQSAPAQAPYAYAVTPVPELEWDGNWPLLAAHLPLRGVAQQLATQAELIECKIDGNAVVFHLRCPIDTWRTPPNVEKLTAALAERFGRPARVETELGPVWYTTAAEQQAHREACQRRAEDTVHNDPFVQAMVREFGAFVVPGSIVAPITPAH
jgi:DNA polymerase-3 subunit gamma/tau